ncbi:MAG: glycosyltransferase [Thermotogota bacterium]|nr:glycosyltransferase [Thermotogota bacterium]
MIFNIRDINKKPRISLGCGWITEPENPRQLAETIQYVFDHPAEAKEKGKKAREKCKREYSWDVMKNSLMEIFGKYRTN